MKGKKVYNFRENGMQLKRESTNFANKTFLGEIKNSDERILSLLEIIITKVFVGIECFYYFK